VRQQPARIRWSSLLLARVVCPAVALVAVGIFVVSVPVYFAELQTVCTAPHTGCLVYAGYSTALQFAFGVAYCTVGALIFWRSSETWGAPLISFWLVTFGTTFAGMTSVLERSYPALDIFYDAPGNLAFFCLLLLCYLFPDGWFVPRWTRWVAIVFAAYVVINELYPYFPYNLDNWGPLLSVPFFLILAGSMMYAQLHRYRVSGAIARQQTKWPVLGFIAAILAFICLGLEDTFQLFPQSGAVGMLSELIYQTIISLAFLFIPWSIFWAIFRYRLYDIDLIIRGTFVYGALIAVYLGSMVIAAIAAVAYFSISVRVSPSLLVAIAGGVLTFVSGFTLQILNRRDQQKTSEREMVQEELRSQDEALQSYLSSIYELLLDHRLREQPGDSDVRRLAQIRTTMLFLSLRGDGKGRLLQLLYDLDLLSRTKPIIDLRNTALTTVNLREGNLKGGELRGADLRNANLTNANLSETCLEGANLFCADLSGADLRGANLMDAKGVSNEQLQQQTKFLEDATMPNGQKYEEWLKSQEGTWEGGENGDSS
jgi:hypothetical protein